MHSFVEFLSQKVKLSKEKKKKSNSLEWKFLSSCFWWKFYALVFELVLALRAWRMVRQIGHQSNALVLIASRSKPGTATKRGRCARWKRAHLATKITRLVLPRRSSLCKSKSKLKLHTWATRDWQFPCSSIIPSYC